ncbi:hypothetical protein U879_04950 [Defluviimonas sp. 20V17]|uniref:DNA gyrase inhibitor YacG n=1 Tax=Allgaiera indica TaxID=765699 RepID=A0AAN4UV20_9RHOB|nr:DNA gyrase inhibitor YacG [Allgaiera indica]KDB04803.1 hypothetical protein U879_04950 [Defluviimonas sp. 20V17]GHE05073.1 DNA gyrase inhibitor YacG [Allgaiera indica]SDX67094.1 hypothetical protein SAMN05444006_12358 [Allgaiera indica]
MSCPICGKPTDPAYRPFCSRRCADVDLAHWLRGDYAIPAQDDEPDETPEGGAEDPDGAAPRGRPH